MKNDPIVDEVCQARNFIFDDCDNDLEKLMDRYHQAESADRNRIVTLESFRKQHTAASSSN